MNVREKVAEALDDVVYPGWTDTYYLGQRLTELEKELPLDSPDAIAALAPYADLALVHERLTATPPKVLVPALLEGLATKTLREDGRRRMRTLLDETLLAEPALVAGLPAAEKTRADGLLRDAGHSLPEATWRSPWSAPTAKKKPRQKEPVATAAYSERVHGSESVLRVPEHEERDESLERQWNLAFQPRQNQRRSPDQLRDLSDGRALKLWRVARAEQLWVWGNLAEPVVRFGVPGLDTSLALIAANLSTDLEAFAPVESPRVAPFMADAFAGRPSQRTVARTWFERFPECAVVGLVAQALGKERVAVQRALAALAHLRRMYPDAWLAGLGRYDEAVRAELEELLARGSELPARKPSLPDFANPARLPRPITADGSAALQGEAFSEFLALLKATPLTGAPWLDELKATFSTASLTRLARALLDAWLGFGAPPKEKWALQALAHFPSDAAAAELAAMAAELAPRGLSARAQEMVEVLAAMQTRTSLKLVHDLSRKVRSKAFRARAELAFTSAAEAMGLTQDELAERLVPTYGLTPEGVLPVEPPIRLVLEGVKPKFVDAAGKPVKKWPEVNEELTELKKKAASLVREAADRLERTMAQGRRLSFDHFTEVYLMHGLTRPLGARLVWGVYGDRGLEATFVPGAKGPVDEQGRPVPFPEGRKVGVAHPLELSEAQVKLWALALPDQPFDQLKRRVTKHAGLQGFRQAMRTYVDRRVPSGALLGLEKRGWQRGPAVGHGCYVTMVRAVPGGVAELEFDPGIYAGDPRMNPTQRISRFELRPGDTTPPLALSELEHDLHEALEVEA